MRDLITCHVVAVQRPRFKYQLSIAFIHTRLRVRVRVRGDDETYYPTLPYPAPAISPFFEFELPTFPASLIRRSCLVPARLVAARKWLVKSIMIQIPND